MTRAPFRIEDIEARLLKTMPALTATQQRVVVTVVRLLAEGTPVAVGEVAGALGLDDETVDAAVAPLQTVVRDESGRIVACCGVTVRETACRLDSDAGRAYMWCAWDALVAPELLERDVRAVSTCPATGERLCLELRRHGEILARPPGVVLSFVVPDPSPDIARSFCRFVRFYASAAAAAGDARDAGLLVLSLEDGRRLARAVYRARFPEQLHARSTADPAR
jgi:hypothetical protein